MTSLKNGSKAFYRLCFRFVVQIKKKRSEGRLIGYKNGSEMSFWREVCREMKEYFQVKMYGAALLFDGV